MMNSEVDSSLLDSDVSSFGLKDSDLMDMNSDVEMVFKK